MLTTVVKYPHSLLAHENISKVIDVHTCKLFRNLYCNQTHNVYPCNSINKIVLKVYDYNDILCNWCRKVL